MLLGRFFGNESTKYGVIIDVGSGSVGMALLFSDPSSTEPQILWSHRERMLIRAEDRLDTTKKLMATTILKAFLELGNDGLKALRQFDKSATVAEIFVSIAAPWSYTVVKTISLNQEKKFRVTKKLIDELSLKATAQGKEAASKDVLVKKLSLTQIGTTTISASVNDYVTRDALNNEAQKLTLTQLTELAENTIVEALRSAADKILPGARLELNTFMDTYYSALNALKPDTSEICLIDITAEATELGIVRNNILEYVTHVPFGSYTIARKIATATSILKEEALGYLRENDIDSTKALSESKREKLKTVVEEYENTISELFRRTGDALSIPKTIFMHTDAAAESFFQTHLREAAKRTTGLEHKIHPMTGKYFKPSAEHDSAILLSAYVFHKNLSGSNSL